MRVVLLLCLVSLLLTAGCTSRRIYESTEYKRVEDCRKLEISGLGDEREKCLAQARMSYSEYQQHTSDDEQP